MQAPVEVPPNAYQQLAAYLRQHPGASKQSAGDIARQLDLPTEMVERVLSNAYVRREETKGTLPETPRENALLQALPEAWGFVKRILSKPPLFAGLSTASAIVLAIVFKAVIPVSGAEVAAAIVLTGLAVFLQFLSFFLSGQARQPIYSALVNWVIITAYVLIALGLKPNAKFNNQAMPFLAVAGLLALSFMLLAVFYAIAGVLAAILGGYVRVRRQERTKEKLGRQELLARLFEIEEQIRQGGQAAPATGFLDRNPFAWIRRNPFLTAALIALGFHIVTAAIMQAIGIRNIRNPEPSIGMAFVGLISMVQFCVMIVVAFLSGTIPRALATVLTFAAVALLAGLIPFGPFGPDFLSTMDWTNWVAMLAFYSAIGLIAGLGAVVEQRAAKDRLLSANDPTTLLGEMLEIQAKLNPDTNTICVMVVDAAKSAEMKAGADPLAVEYSFREYQKLIEKTSSLVGGRVHATAGDGAIVAFEGAGAAFEAARRIQTDIEGFNLNVNRISAPFRLRVGLHMGAVAGDLQKVEFTEVIDIAAHVQGVAPIGGIALTEVVVNSLPDVETIPLREPVDGQNIYLALNPKVEV